MIRKSELLDIEEVEYSEKHLKSLFSKFQKEELGVGLMGGWAVHLLIQKGGKDHIGSRDIDIFFDPEGTKLEKIIKVVEGEGFKPHSTFRWALFIDRLQGKEVSEEESKRMPLHNLFTVYVDVFSSRDVGNPHIFPEPLLAEVSAEHEVVEFDGLEIIIPTPTQMVKLKLKSVLDREEDKQVKDLIDLFALITEFPETLEKIERNAGLRDKFRVTLDRFVTDGAVSKAGANLGVELGVVESILRRI
ncbi:MAG: hypothetical protein KKB24_00240 [Candidatus Altiarchaeota archaeon]|nr:hypothetical protein [Candidatus Altiarchaeota archaeon]MBU4405996.1 hypothetical protein [Candidatus Altiarchaeota archaeon]MBU4437027.1 hypothetical protein [Candidatus Altiarchaeota archaeon]